MAYIVYQPGLKLKGLCFKQLPALNLDNRFEPGLNNAANLCLFVPVWLPV
jgi:hypothetical protein